MTEKNYPHLPPRACRVDTHIKIGRLRWLFFIVFIAVLSGLAASLSTIAWLAPITSGDYGLNVLERRAEKSVPDSLLVRQVKQRLVTIYNKKERNKLGMYKNQAAKGEAILLSSDGWVVMWWPVNPLGEEKNWEAVDYQGVAYGIEKKVYDSKNSFLYLKLKGESFRISPFTDWKTVGQDKEYWAVRSGEWQRVTVTDLLARYKEAWSINETAFVYKFDSYLTAGTILVDDQGSLVGFIDEETQGWLAWPVEGQLGNVLGSGSLVSQGLNWTGYLVEALAKGDQVVPLSGFYLTVVGDGPVKAGDLLIKLNNESLNKEMLAWQVQELPEEFTVVVWRQGQETELKINKQVIES